MTEKFTPGPWRIGMPGPNGCMTIGTVAGEMVAVIAHSLNESEQRKTAPGNARLISSAPELLSALCNLIDELSESDDEGLIEHSETISSARAAIAKATGASK